MFKKLKFECFIEIFESIFKKIDSNYIKKWCKVFKFRRFRALQFLFLAGFEIDSIVIYDRNSQLFDKTLLRFGGVFCFFIVIEWFTYLTLLFSVDSQNIERILKYFVSCFNIYSII